MLTVQPLDLESMTSMQVLMASSHRQVLREDGMPVKSSVAGKVTSATRSHRGQSTASADDTSDLSFTSLQTRSYYSSTSVHVYISAF